MLYALTNIGGTYMKNNFKDIPNAKDRILSSTLYIIGKEGFQNVTTRKIAAAADVNIASINYHFGSKDNVINEALKCVTSKFITSFKILDNKQLTPIERIRGFLRSYSDVSVEYPDVFRNFVNKLIFKEELQPEYMKFIQQEGIKCLRDILEELTSIKDDYHLYMMALQIISSLIFPVLLDDRVTTVSKINYKDKNVRYDYVELLISSVKHK
jgi:AcrR family transcriptional regulator